MIIIKADFFLLQWVWFIWSHSNQMKIQTMGAKTIFSCFLQSEVSIIRSLRSICLVNFIFLLDFVSKWKHWQGECFFSTIIETTICNYVVSYSNVAEILEGYEIKSALPFKIFSTLPMKPLEWTSTFRKTSSINIPFTFCFVSICISNKSEFFLP